MGGIKYEGAKLCFAVNNRNTKLCKGFRRNIRSEWGAETRREDVGLVKNIHGSKRRWVGNEWRWLEGLHGL